MGTVPFEEEQKDKDRRHAHHPLSFVSVPLSFVSDSLWNWQERREQGGFRAGAPLKT